MRSLTEETWGEMKVPVVRPWAQASEVMSRVVVVFPFVPVTWMEG
jgi:hypothetical protein